MPAKDIFHDAVRTGLEKDGWHITDDPYFIKFGARKMYVDLAAEKMLAAEKGLQKIAVEIKSFAGGSLVDDFHHAVGQFMNYRRALTEQEPERILFLAVPLDTYEEFFCEALPQAIIRENGFKLIVYSAKREEIILWIN